MLRILVFVVVTTCTGRGESGVTESRVVNIKQGPVRGYLSSDGDFYVFHGVPYATAPTGTQKFKGPLPPPVWVDTYDAVNKGIVCPQIDYGIVINGDTEGKENCLIANLYVPKTDKTDLPVLVYIHGGGYIFGFGEQTKPKHLAITKRAIIVNFNYRLGVQGFLCLGTEDIPGNAGMKDQVALLRWVKDNIASFGGNPDDITVAGQSAGSSSVDLLQLSKMANNLFKKTIPESGANTAAFSVQPDPIKNAKDYARLLNFSNVEDIYALEEFYKTASLHFLYSAKLLAKTDSTFSFSPCVERDTGTERFLEDSPVNILKSGNYQKRPMLYGFSNMEGLIQISTFEIWKDLMNTKFSDFLPADLDFKSEVEKEEVAEIIKKFYFNSDPISSDNILAYINYFTDTIFAYSTLRSVRLQVEAGNNQIYLYEYAYVDDDTPIIPYTNIRGADHCAQSFAISDGVNMTHTDESIASDSMKNMKKTLREMWLNFVETGKPVPEGSSLPAWPPTGVDGSPYMALNKVSQLKMTPLLDKRIQFWHKIYNKYYRNPIPPSLSPIHTEL